MGDVEVEFNYRANASRSELLVRIPYVLILLLLGGVWGVAAEFVIVLQWFHVLLAGRRSRTLWSFVARFLKFYARFWAYAGILTDIRPIQESGTRPRVLKVEDE